MTMAKEYIDRQSIYDRVKTHTNPYGKPTLDYESGLKVLDMIKTELAADVAEVRHGKWVYHESVSSYDGLKSGYACSVCSGFVNEDIFDMDEFNKAFCGACGAKMDGKEGKEQ